MTWKEWKEVIDRSVPDDTEVDWIDLSSGFVELEEGWTNKSWAIVDAGF